MSDRRREVARLLEGRARLGLENVGPLGDDFDVLVGDVGGVVARLGVGLVGPAGTPTRQSP